MFMFGVFFMLCLNHVFVIH